MRHYEMHLTLERIAVSSQWLRLCSLAARSWESKWLVLTLFWLEHCSRSGRPSGCLAYDEMEQ